MKEGASMIAELRGVTKTYGSVVALDDLTLELEAGRVTAILGPNGAGKTSAIRLLLGLTRPTKGTVALFGTDPRSPAARRRTGVMLQIAKVPETLTVREHVHLFCSYYPSPMGPNSAPPIVNLIYLPMSFLSGLWIPFEILPPVVKTIAPFLPAFHLGQLALGAIGAGAGTPAWSHVAALGGFTLIGLGLAFWGYRRDEDRTWG
jgi:ABC-type Fe3+/spermidine/putrescine transport system ATPase subunit